MSTIPRPPPAEDFLGQACSWCGRPVESLKGMSLSCTLKARPWVWRLFHVGCLDEYEEGEMTKLLGGRVGR